MYAVFMADKIKKLAAEIGARARARREELGLTVMQVATTMGRTYQCIHGMENSGTVHLRVILEWAEALRMAPAELAFGDKKRADLNLVADLSTPRVLLSEAAELIDGRQGKRKLLVQKIRKYLG